MSEKFDIPFKSDMVPKILEEDTKIQFRCHKGISCFNACCKKADITLTPYDVLRLKKRLGMSSGDFLKQHTVPFEMDGDKVPGIKMRTDEAGACLFVTEQGCSVYEDRPAACRYYPVGHLAMKPKDEKTERTSYFLVQEEHCKGHQEAREISIGDYRKEQEVEAYDDMNHEWYQIMLKKKSAGPTVGKPPEMSLQLFFMCSYDLDRFRRFVLSESFKNTYLLEDETYAELERDDEALLKFGYRLLKHVLFGELSIPERKGVWEKRFEERTEVFELRRQAEIALKQQAEDDKYKNDV
jgi:Fe-S-cluster containining protein